NDSQTRGELLRNKQEGMIPGRRITDRAIPFKLNAEQFNELFSQLSDNHRKLAEGIQSLIHEVHNDSVVPVFWEVFGERMDNREDHFPGPRLTKGDDAAKNILNTFHGNASLKQIQNAGIYQARTGGNQPFIIHNIMSVAMSQVSMAATLQKAEAVSTARIMLNSPRVKKAVTAGMKNGAQYLSSIDYILTQFSGMETPSNSIDVSFMNFVRENVAKYALGLKVQIWLYQATSLITASTRMPARHIAKGVITGRTVSVIRQDIDKWSAKLSNRIEQQAHQLANPGYTGRMLQRFWNRGKTTFDFALAPISMVDTWTVTRLWEAKILEGKEKGLEGDRLMEWVARESESLVDETQPTWDPISSSIVVLKGRQNAILGLATMFTSQLQKHTNIAVQGAVDYSRSDKTAKDLAKFVHNALVPSVVGGAWIMAIAEGVSIGIGMLGGADDDPEELAERAKHRLIRNVSGNYLVFGPAAFDAYNAHRAVAEEKPVRVRGSVPAQFTRSALQAYSSTSKAISHKGEKVASGPDVGEPVSSRHWNTAFRNSLTAIGMATGLPTSAVNQWMYPFFKDSGKYRNPHVQRIVSGSTEYAHWDRLLGDVAKGVMDLIVSVAKNASVEVVGESLLVRASIEDHQRIAKLFESLAAGGELYEIEVSHFAIPSASLSTRVRLMLEEAVRGQLTEEGRKTLASLDVNKGSRGATVTARPGRWTEYRSLRRRTYVPEYEVEIAQAASIADPIALLATEGLKAVLRPFPLQDGRTLLRVYASAGDLDKEMRRFEMRSPERTETLRIRNTDYGMLEQSDFRGCAVSTEMVLTPGVTAGILAGYSRGLTHVLLFRLKKAPPAPKTGTFVVMATGALSAEDPSYAFDEWHGREILLSPRGEAVRIDVDELSEFLRNELEDDGASFLHWASWLRGGATVVRAPTAKATRVLDALRTL
ncbi:MAG: hypothetical protein IH897_13055, partial [Planctomycetes bacterium]|nr:hypothetical protein [Planctomycetota bacterium]